MELLENPDLDEGPFDNPGNDENLDIILKGPEEGVEL